MTDPKQNFLEKHLIQRDNLGPLVTKQAEGHHCHGVDHLKKCFVRIMRSILRANLFLTSRKSVSNSFDHDFDIKVPCVQLKQSRSENYASYVRQRRAARSRLKSLITPSASCFDRSYPIITNIFTNDEIEVPQRRARS